MTKKTHRRTLFAVGLFCGAISLILLILPYYFLGQEAYIPKTSPDIGYFLPKSLEAWIFLIIGLFLLTVSFACIIFYVRKSEVEEYRYVECAVNGLRKNA